MALSNKDTVIGCFTKQLKKWDLSTRFLLGKKDYDKLFLAFPTTSCLFLSFLDSHPNTTITSSVKLNTMLKLAGPLVEPISTLLFYKFADGKPEWLRDLSKVTDVSRTNQAQNLDDRAYGFLYHSRFFSWRVWYGYLTVSFNVDSRKKNKTLWCNSSGCLREGRISTLGKFMSRGHPDFEFGQILTNCFFCLLL